jgi:2,5-furandicarboxylate decarboxylase 1
MGYRDLREYLNKLEDSGKLHHVTCEVDKDWEIAAVTRGVFQDIPDPRRPALMFDRIKGYSNSLVVGVLGGSLDIYALALQTTVDGIEDVWKKAYTKPIPPVKVNTGPCKEVIETGKDVDALAFPIPVWTVGQDPSPYLTAPQVFSVDPHTGVGNVGTYRIQMREKARLGLMVNLRQHLRKQIGLYEEKAAPTPIAIVLGSEPAVPLTSVSKIPYDMDEVAVAGGLRGEPVEVVRCETNDLLVPANAELVIEGFIPAGVREHEGPFGEFTGYMGVSGDSYVVEVTAITRRKDPIIHAFLSQMPPSESSTIKAYGRERAILRYLRDQRGIRVRDVHLTTGGSATAFLAISMTSEFPGQAIQAMWGAWSVDPALGKFTVVVDSDIDVRDPFELQWAMCFHVQPQKDIYVFRDTPAMQLDPSVAPADVEQHIREQLTGSKVGIDAMRKFLFPAVAIPPKEHMVKVRSQWQRYGFAK